MSMERVANFILQLQDVPDSAIDAAAVLLIDTLAVAAGAAGLEASRIARNHSARFLNSSDAGNTATLLFDGRTVSIPGAAFAAATQIDNLDAHDGYNPTKGHIGCAVVPALCTFAEQIPDLSARDALAAMVIAYEVAARAGVSLHTTVSDYHTSGAWNALAVAALGCRLRKHNLEQLRHALGIAEYHGPRSQMMREIANPTMLHDGSSMGALVGCMAVLMAEDGFEGAPAITVESEEVSQHWESLGTHWTIEENYIKPYPICRWAHAALDALNGLRNQHGFEANDVSRITVHTFNEAAALFDGMPSSTSQAQYSLAFALATLLVRGHIGPQHIQGASLKDSEVEDTLQKIVIEECGRHSDRFPDKRWSSILVELSNGIVLESGDVHARGGPEAPMSRAEIKEKFLNFTGKLEPIRQTQIWDELDLIKSRRHSFSSLLKLVHGPIEPNGS